jgi:hypothetical protein
VIKAFLVVVEESKHFLKLDFSVENPFVFDGVSGKCEGVPAPILVEP